MKIRKATSQDYEVIRNIEDESFGVHVIPDEAKLIVEEGYGDICLAIQVSKPIAYLAVLYREYDDKTEEFLQPLLRFAKSNEENVMHDDVEFDEDKYVYFHLLGVLPEFQKQGVGSKLLKYAREEAKKRSPNKYLKACIRINNLPSIKACMKELDVCMTGIKPNNWDIIGSIETNFHAVSGSKLRPVLDPLDVTTRITYKDLERFPKSASFLIPVEYGEEKDLEESKLEDRLRTAFEKGYIVTGLFGANELDMKGESFFLCERVK